MIKNLSVIILVMALFFNSCDRPRYKACLHTAKDTFAVGETIWFTNCSDFDGGPTENAAVWMFEPNQTDLIVTSGNDSISWVYTQAGLKNPALKIGTKEQGDQVSKTIIIK
ncbi:MAG: hypothetical protein IT257_01660 [Chitinophagaceae bacterium]|nr:hypothetical protein [Chitinophagaceae bacterium]